MSAETPLSTYLPDGEVKGGVVLVQEAFGVNSHIKDVGQRLADSGWAAVAPHLFYRHGDPELDYTDMGPVMEQMGALKAEEITVDLDAAFAKLDELGIASSRQAIVGFCMGGALSFITATQRKIGAAVTFYGAGITSPQFGFPSQLELAPNLSTPWLGLYGELDSNIPEDQVEALKHAVAATGVATEVVRYAGADHGFNCDVRASYNPEAAGNAWPRMLTWLEDHAAAG